MSFAPQHLYLTVVLNHAPTVSVICTLHQDEVYDRARGNLDRHGVHFLTAYVAGV